MRQEDHCKFEVSLIYYEFQAKRDTLRQHFSKIKKKDERKKKRGKEKEKKEKEKMAKMQCISRQPLGGKAGKTKC